MISRYDLCSLPKAFLVLLAVGGISLHGQGIRAGTPSREYVRLQGQVIAIETVESLQSQINIDLPVRNTTYSGTQTFSGWAVDNTATIGAVELAIDGVSYGNAIYGLSRPDVCNYVGSKPGCPNVGWNVPVNTAEFGNGLHTLTVTSVTADLVPRRSTLRTIFWISNSSPAPVNTSGLHVDLPSWQSTYDGVQTFYGWAVDQSATINRVTVAIDGVAYDNAQNGLSRPDVCHILGQLPGCPNVGWALTFDTSSLAEGQHTLVVTAYTSDALPRHTTSTMTFSVANEYGPSMYVDSPSWNATWSGQQTIFGWALDSGSPIGAVAISIDGNSYGLASYGGGRPDACNAMGQSNPGCPSVGWSFPIDTATLTNGQHTLTVTAFTAEQDPVPISQSVLFSTNNSNAAAQNQSVVDIDLPVVNKYVSGTQHFFGWSIDNTAAIARITYAIDGISYGNANYGSSRPDVCNAYPGRAGCPNVGWDLFFDTARLTDGYHTLTVTAFTNDPTPRASTATIVFGTSNSQ